MSVFGKCPEIRHHTVHLAHVIAADETLGQPPFDEKDMSSRDLGHAISEGGWAIIESFIAKGLVTLEEIQAAYREENILLETKQVLESL